MKISRTKTEYMIIGTQDHREELAGEEIKNMKAFKYLGSAVQDDGHAVVEINKMQIGWQNWRKVTSIICDNRNKTKRKAVQICS